MIIRKPYMLSCDLELYYKDAIIVILVLLQFLLEILSYLLQLALQKISLLFLKLNLQHELTSFLQ